MSMDLCGVAALPSWALTEYLDQGWLHTCQLGPKGVWRTLYAAVRSEDADADYIRAFVDQAQTTCFKSLSGIKSASRQEAVVHNPSKSLGTS